MRLGREKEPIQTALMSMFPHRKLGLGPAGDLSNLYEIHLRVTLLGEQ